MSGNEQIIKCPKCGYEIPLDAMVEAFKAMKEDLDKERIAMEKQWAKRDKQIERVLLNTAGMYGDLQGIIGNALPAVKTLELPSGGDE